MGDAAGQVTDGFHALGLAQLLFERLPFHLGGDPHREDAQHRLHPFAFRQPGGMADGDQPQRPAIAGEQRVAGIAVDADVL